MPLETPISVPACSWDKPSRSTSLKASISAGSIVRGLAFIRGCGINFSTFEGVGMVTGLGNLPLLPLLHLLLDIKVSYSKLCRNTYIFLCII